MSEDMNTALMLLGVGMITVFIVLSCVVLLGNLLISFVNQFVPAVITQSGKLKTGDGIASVKIAAISAAVEIFTKGKGNVSSIKKLE